MKKPHIYIDTSVLGGYFDDDFAEATKRLFDALRERKWVALVSDLVRREVAAAPVEIRRLLDELPETAVERVDTDDECRALAAAYLDSGVLPRTMRADALHVAIATCRHADLLVTWNFRHLANWARARGFAGVNLRLGYPIIEIRSPWEVSFDDEPSET